MYTSGQIEIERASARKHIYFKSFFNDAIVTNPGREFILNIRYDEVKLKTDQNISLPENSIKVIYKDNVADDWQILDQTILNTNINQATVITNKGGYFALVAGWWATPEPTPFPWATLWEKAKKYIKCQTGQEDLFAPSEYLQLKNVVITQSRLLFLYRLLCRARKP